MSIRSTLTSLNLLVSIFIAGALSSCEEEITDIGTAFLRDTVITDTRTFDDIFATASRTKQVVNANGSFYNLNYASPYMFFGIAPEESVEAWAVIKVPFVEENLGAVTSVDLVLSMPFPFVYGSAAENVEFTVYTESKKLIAEATTTLSLADLDPEPVATFQGTVADDSVATFTIRLDSAKIAPLLRTVGLSLVIVPHASMKNVRSFASTDFSTSNNRPHLAVTFTKTNPDSTYTQNVFPSYDFHVVRDQSVPPADQFTLRGAVARRERVTIDIKALRERLAIDPFATVNTALLQLHLVSKSTAIVPVDTVPPVLVEISTPATEDSAEFLAAYGILDPTNSSIYNFQLRGFIEQALRMNQDSLVVELRTGFTANPTRTINFESIGVEDYHLNRWTFYNMNAPDSLKRPRLSITYSYLR